MTKNNQVVSVFGSMNADCVRSNKQLRQGLFKSLLSIFADNWDDKTLLNYVGSTCAHLPYLTVNEPLFCIRELSSIVAVEGGAVVDGLKGILGVASSASRRRTTAGSPRMSSRSSSRRTGPPTRSPTSPSSSTRATPWSSCSGSSTS